MNVCIYGSSDKTAAQKCKKVRKKKKKIKIFLIFLANLLIESVEKFTMQIRTAEPKK